MDLVRNYNFLVSKYECIIACYIMSTLNLLLAQNASSYISFEMFKELI